MSPLPVHLFDRYAGDVAIDGPLRSPEDWTFAYAPAWLATPGA